MWKFDEFFSICFFNFGDFSNKEYATKHFLKFLFFEFVRNCTKKPNLQIMIFIIAIPFRLGDNYNILKMAEFSKFNLPKMSKIKEIASRWWNFETQDSCVSCI
jgi:hypothetical protein